MYVLALRNPLSLLKVFLAIGAIAMTLIGGACTPQTPDTTPGPLIEVLEGTRPAIASFRTRPTNTPTPTSEVSASETAARDDTSAASDTPATSSNSATSTLSSNNAATPTQTPTSQNLSPPTLSSATRTPNPALPSASPQAGSPTPSPTPRPNQSPSLTPTRTLTGSTAGPTPTPSITSTSSPTTPAPGGVPSNGWTLSRINVITDSETIEMHIYGIARNDTGDNADLVNIDAIFRDAQGQVVELDDNFEGALNSTAAGGEIPFHIYVDVTDVYSTMALEVEESEPLSESLRDDLVYGGIEALPYDEDYYIITGMISNPSGKAPLETYIEVAVALKDASDKIIGIGYGDIDLFESPLNGGQSVPFEAYVFEYYGEFLTQTIEVYFAGF